MHAFACENQTKRKKEVDNLNQMCVKWLIGLGTQKEVAVIIIIILRNGSYCGDLNTIKW